MAQARRASRRSKDQARSGAERITLIVSFVLLVLLIGGLVVLEQQRGNEPARVQVTPHFSKLEEHDGDWYLPVTIQNVGDQATDALRVDLVRPVEGEQPEVAELDYTFVAGGEQVEGIAVFDEEPSTDSIEVDVVSVTDP
jgi:uncharacterized protein (TIGR02588 family)